MFPTCQVPPAYVMPPLPQASFGHPVVLPGVSGDELELELWPKRLASYLDHLGRGIPKAECFFRFACQYRSRWVTRQLPMLWAQ